MSKWHFITVWIVAGLILTGCTSEESPPAQISSVGQGASGRNIQKMEPSASHPGQIVYNRNYDSIPKGGYSGNTYTVKRGDTLFYIAWISGSDFRDLAQRNNISEPYQLEIGQTIKIGGSAASVNSGKKAAPQSNSLAKGGVTGQYQPGTVDSQGDSAYAASAGKPAVDKMLPSAEPAPAAIGNWLWPTQGKVIENFSLAEGGNKGIDIAGTRGQPVLATASGRVVYAGTLLRGYGNLIIIKHNDDYLSAYAHNDSMLVREQEEVKAGQKIATMGSTGTSSVRLHFEIRYKGKSVNPLRYLPQR